MLPARKRAVVRDAPVTSTRVGAEGVRASAASLGVTAVAGRTKVAPVTKVGAQPTNVVTAAHVSARPTDPRVTESARAARVQVPSSARVPTVTVVRRVAYVGFEVGCDYHLRVGDAGVDVWRVTDADGVPCQGFGGPAGRLQYGVCVRFPARRGYLREDV